MTVLVTGGAGYIGSAVAAELLKAGHRVLIYDNLSHGHRRAAPKGAELVVADIADRAALDQVFKTRPVEAVMHFAALIEAGESMKNPAAFFRNNTANALTLLESMLAHGVKKFVFSSTAALFGNPERTPIEEDDPVRPTSVYGESKLMVEQMLTWLNRIHGLRYASLRYFNAAGAMDADHGEDHHPESHLIPLILKVALGQIEHINILGADYPTPDGTCVRDYVHVADLASAHLLALDALERRDRLIYNLGAGRGFSVREVIETARKVTGHPIPVVESPRRQGDPAILIASSAKIKSELNWRPQFTDLETIVASAWQWHRAHPGGYED
jgi:UDP-glucose 4-epimerase